MVLWFDSIVAVVAVVPVVVYSSRSNRSCCHRRPGLFCWRFRHGSWRGSLPLRWADFSGAAARRLHSTFLGVSCAFTYRNRGTICEQGMHQSKDSFCTNGCASSHGAW